MKNVFMSILLVFMLTVSIFGTAVDVAKADSNNMVMSEITDVTVIKGVDNSVDLTFTVRNTDDANDLTVDITSTNPETSDQLNTLTVEGGALVEDDLVLGQGAQATEVEFTVNIAGDSVVGDYTGTVRLEDTADNTNFLEQTYVVSLEDSNPRVTVTSLTDEEDEELVFTGEEDSTSENSFTIRNNGNRVINDLQLTFPNEGEFEDADDNQINFRIEVGDQDSIPVDLGEPIDLGALAVDESLNINIRTNIPQDIDLEIYSGEVSLSSETFEGLSTGLTDDSFDLIVKVEPEVCEDGRVHDEEPVDGPRAGKGLRLKIEDPDNGDDYNIGDEVEVTVEVENEMNKDVDVVVELMLYDLDQADEISIDVEGETELEIEDGEKEDFDLTFTIPVDNEDIDPDNTYMLYVKAYEDGDEDKECNYDGIELRIDRENDHVIVNALTIVPSVVNQGDLVSFRVSVQNVGTDEQKDVYIELKNDELGIDLRSSEFDLKKYDKNENDNVKTFTFTVPSDAEAKEYWVEAIVHFDRERESTNALGKLEVQGEPTPETEDTTGTADSTVTTGADTTGAGTYEQTGGSVFDGLGSTKTLFIIGDIVLVILAVLFLILIFKKR